MTPTSTHSPPPGPSAADPAQARGRWGDRSGGDPAPDGRRLLSGVEAVCEALLVRRALDERAGLDTATFVSGYPGSPLGTLDLALERLGRRLGANRIVHQPGLNEELAAAAVWGSQMGEAVPYDGVDGVVGAWYGKGPGLDRCGDVLKHANFMGTGPERRRRAVRRRRPVGQVVDAPVRHQRPAGRRRRPGARARRPAGPARPGGRGVPAQPGLRVVGRRPHRHRGRRRHRRGRHRSRPASPPPSPTLVVDGEPWRHAAERHDPAARPRGAVARPPPAGRPGVGRGPGPRPVRRRRSAGARLGIVCAGPHLPRRARRLRGVRRRPRRPRRRRHPHPEAGPDLRRSSRRRCSALADACDEILVVEEKRPFVEQQVRAILHEAGRTTPVRGKRDARRPPARARHRRADRRAAGRRAAPGPARPRPHPGSRRPGTPRSRAPPPARPARPHAGVLQRLPAQPLDRRARGLDHRRRRRLPRDDPLRAPPRRRALRAAHAHGRRGRALGRAGAVRRRPPHLPEPRRRHVQPLGQPRHPGVRGGRASTSRSSCSTTRRSP